MLAAARRVRSAIRVPIRGLFADITRFLTREDIVGEILTNGVTPSIINQVTARTADVERALTVRMSRAVTRVVPNASPGLVAAVSAEQAQVLTQRLISQQEAVLTRLGPLVAQSGDPDAVDLLAQAVNLPPQHVRGLARRLEQGESFRSVRRRAAGQVRRRHGTIAEHESLTHINATIEASASEVPDTPGQRILKQSVSRRDARVDEICAMADNGDRIAPNQAFANGLKAPPYHIGCRCVLRLWEVRVEDGSAVLIEA